ncbi:multidrug effflux MFS transporter [Nocardioides pacificus]
MSATTAARPDLTGRHYVRLVLSLGCLIALGPLTIDMYLPAFPQIARDLDASQSQVQLTVTGILIGLGLGQLLVGPLSDALGRRRPLLVGLCVHAVASIGCLLAPTVETLAGVRVLQGLAGAAVSVTVMAMVRDQLSGKAMASLMARLMLVMGLAPMLAPSLGGLVLEWSGWRTIFLVLAVAALVLAGLAGVGLRETLPPPRRRPARLGAVLTAYGRLVRDPYFMALAVTGGSMMATIFAYVSGGSFVLQEGFGLSERTFAIVFGINALGLVLGSQANPLLLRRFSLVQVLTGGVAMTFCAALTLVVLAALDVGGLVGVLAPLFVVLSTAGVSMANTPALALDRQGAAAGTAAAVLGCLQFAVGAAVAPLVGAFDTVSAVPMAAVMAGVSGLALLLVTTVVRRG